jgi:hypothetical protein
MSYPPHWDLEGFPGEVGGVPDEVEKAYAGWVESRRVNPKTRAQRLQGDDIRYTAEVPSAVYADEHGGHQLWCDFEVHEPGLTSPGRVVFVEMGFIAGDDLGE